MGRRKLRRSLREPSATHRFVSSGRIAVGSSDIYGFSPTRGPIENVKIAALSNAALALLCDVGISAFDA